MKIRTKFGISTVISIGIAIVLGLIIVSITVQIHGQEEKVQITQSIVKDVFDLNMVAGDYLLHQEERAEKQWFMKHDSLAELLESIKADGQKEELVLRDVRENHAYLENLFFRVVTAYKSKFSSEEEAASSLELRQRLASQLSVRSQTMVSGASQLHRTSLARLTSYQQKAYLLLIIFVSLIVCIMAATFLLTSATILKPIIQLGRGTEIIGAGNFDFRVATNAKDEIGQLSRAFDRMIEKLRATTVSRDELAKEVAERKRTEADLRKSNGELENTKRAILNLAEDIEIARDNLEKQKDELEGAKAALESSNAELEQFAYVASHDLQEPLRKIRSFGERLRAKCSESLTDQGMDYLQRMENAAKRMSSLINDILTLSRVATKGQPFCPVNLKVIAGEVLGDLETRIEQMHAQVEIGDLPVIDADPTQMRQLMQNLIGNALKFNNEDGRPIIKIESAIIKDSGKTPQARITVEDNGIGFDQQYAKRVFVIFQRLHGRTEYAGTGMGLAICRKIVERHGGRITARSKVGEGSTFTVTLPVNQSTERGI